MLRNRIEMFSEKINHVRLQQVLVFTMGVLSIAVLLTSCAHSSSCSAYQEVEIVEWFFTVIFSSDAWGNEHHRQSHGNERRSTSQKMYVHAKEKSFLTSLEERVRGHAQYVLGDARHKVLLKHFWTRSVQSNGCHAIGNILRCSSWSFVAGR